MSASQRTHRTPWLVLPDPFPTRVFVDCGIVAALEERLSGELQVVLALPPNEARDWGRRIEPTSWMLGEELLPRDVAFGERVLRRIDLALDRNVGYYPLSVRHSLRNGFNAIRMRPGHPNLFLDSSHTGRLPDSEVVDRVMRAWLFSRRRYVSKMLRSRMRETCSGIVVANVQSHKAVPFLVAARRLGLPVVGYIASWDHTVGKGLVSPHVTTYVVQNAVMGDDLVRYHGIPPARVVVTGWPQSDIFARPQPRQRYDDVLRGLSLDPGRQVVLVAGNTPTNAPYEGRFVERIVRWAASADPSGRPQLLFRPHPRDVDWRERFAAALAVESVAVQEPSYTDLDVLATLLQHVDCVIANAGTILLDALMNDRPAVCVLYDEGAPPDDRHAELNVTGTHYAELVRSGAFVRAHGFEDVVAGLERSLTRRDELSAERRRVVAEVVGDIDGQAAERVVDAIVGTVAPSARSV